MLEKVTLDEMVMVVVTVPDGVGLSTVTTPGDGEVSFVGLWFCLSSEVDRDVEF